MPRCPWIWFAVLLAGGACGAGTSDGDEAQGGGAVSSSSSTAEKAQPGPVEVTVEGRGLGALKVAVGAATPAAANEAKPWVEHELTLTNEGDSVVYVNDFRRGFFVGDRRVLLVATEGCGYASGGGDEPVEPACQEDYRPLQIQPHKSHVVKLTLWKGLPGMSPLESGQFALKHTVQYREDRAFDDPRQTGSAGTILVTYTVT